VLQRDAGLVGARGDSAVQARTITFTTSRLSLMITVTATGDTARVDGWIAPAAELAIEARTPDGTLHSESDADGRFVFDAVPRGLVQFFVRAEDAQPIATPSVEI